jgi:hypothetical protein
MAPKHGLRRGRLSARDGAWAGAAPSGTDSDYATGATLSDPFADEASELVVPMDDELTDDVAPEPRPAGYRSKHRLADQEGGDRRPEIRRGAGRHAAPPSGIASRMAGRLALHPLAVRD